MRTYILQLFSLVLLIGCQVRVDQSGDIHRLSSQAYLDKLRAAWQAIMVANHTGLAHEGLYLDEPSPLDSVDLVLLEQWSTDDDTAVEWVDLHILETYGLNPTYAQIRDEWVDHLNHDIWVSTRRARDLMDEGVLPPDTGSADLNPEGVWSIDAQLQTELFGMISPGLPERAVERARYFARVTNSGLAVEVSAFYAAMYAGAFFESSVPTLIDTAREHFPQHSVIDQIVENVINWHKDSPDDWRLTRERIRQEYDTDISWWASKVNFASTIMALLYGKGELVETLNIALLAGWDADNNATTSAGLLGIILGFENLPYAFRSASQVYHNEDVTGDLPQYETVLEIASRTARIGEEVIRTSGGLIENGDYLIPVGD